MKLEELYQRKKELEEQINYIQNVIEKQINDDKEFKNTQITQSLKSWLKQNQLNSTWLNNYVIVHLCK